MRIISVIMMLSRLQSDGLRPREARPKAFLLENGGGDWGKVLGGGGVRARFGTTEAYNPEVTIATLCNKIIACVQTSPISFVARGKGTYA